MRSVRVSYQFSGRYGCGHSAVPYAGIGAVPYAGIEYRTHVTKVLRHASVALPSVTPRDLRGYRATAAVTPARHEALCCDVTRDSVNVNQGGQRQQ